jgi:hypothetical protein
MSDPTAWTRDELDRHSVDLRQFIDFRSATLSTGMRIIEAYNSSGLTFSVLPDRGLDIWTAHYNGLPLTWISPGSPHPPDFGQSWLRQFNGGLLTTCGLTHVGPPEVDDVTGERRDLHGNYSRLRTHNITVTALHADDSSAVPALELSGTVHEAELFGAQLQVQRRMTLRLGVPTVTIRDRITNIGDRPADLMMLYHVNVGFPLVRNGARLSTPHMAKGVLPRDKAAAAGLRAWNMYADPTPDYPEQVFFHQLQQVSGRTSIVLANDSLSIKLAWLTADLPYFTQWKNTRQGSYVCGIEPGNCIPEGRNRARSAGRLRTLDPSQQVEHRLDISATDELQTIQRWLTGVELIRRDGSPITGCRLADFAAKRSPR